MYRSAEVAITAPDDAAQVYLGGHGNIPIIAFGPRAEPFTITLNSHLLSPAEQSAWLRSLAVQLEDLAEQVDVRAGEKAAEQSITEAKAAAGIGGNPSC